MFYLSEGNIGPLLQRMQHKKDSMLAAGVDVVTFVNLVKLDVTSGGITPDPNVSPHVHTCHQSTHTYTCNQEHIRDESAQPPISPLNSEIGSPRLRYQLPSQPSTKLQQITLIRTIAQGSHFCQWHSTTDVTTLMLCYYVTCNLLYHLIPCCVYVVTLYKHYTHTS